MLKRDILKSVLGYGATRGGHGINYSLWFLDIVMYLSSSKCVLKKYCNDLEDSGWYLT